MADKTQMKYKCYWPGCGHEFKMMVGTSSGEKHSRISTHVVCPRCGNGLKTWKGE